MKQFDLTGKVALVAGASGGFGNAIAFGLAQAGSNVALAGRNMERLTALEKRIKALDRNTIVVQMDISILNQIKEKVDKIVKWGQKIDIFINCAGINLRKYALETQEDEWDELMSINLKGAFFAATTVASQMVKQGKGKIVNVSSVAGVKSLPRSSMYGISKAGVSQMTRQLALELAESNIQVNAIAPGLFKTEMTKATFDDKDRLNLILSGIPTKEYGLPEKIVGLTTFLCSEASDYMTGQVIYIDGGWTLT